jgi:hypothetical protein
MNVSSFTSFGQFLFLQNEGVINVDIISPKA